MTMKRLFLALALALAPFVALADAFKPIDNSTIAVSASTSNATGTFTVAPTGPDFQVRIYNSCSTTAFIRFGGAATTSNIPIPAGTIEVYTVPAFTTTVGVILASGSGCNVYSTLGRGE
jgi:hypothetical protein